jgi:endonuclease/exonuclease/phosphatase (EEP) superfamily protein YafD
LIPILRVDYIWLSGELNSMGAWVGEDTGSDHLPVLARLALGANSHAG